VEGRLRRLLIRSPIISTVLLCIYEIRLIPVSEPTREGLRPAIGHAPVDQLIHGALHMRELMPLARPSMRCFSECAIDPHYHSLSWFGDNTRMIDFLADLLFNAFADSERSVACRGII
jgi:hypothetical protein